MHCDFFHSIRFKVNKGWSTAVLLFLCPIVRYTVLTQVNVYPHSHSPVSFSVFGKAQELVQHNCGRKSTFSIRLFRKLLIIL
ncbi:hypothetical protein DXA68_00150 [Bacteroides stercorirosoris]|uniref:Uncharacterized protein n=1 Tax=Bacteroides stercorirosoris TaxID=871324 RepID=A0A413HBJ3_9BACE|nr:hypothetical protein DXA68_00150 [Bacteroides stercorirosoris]